MARQCTICGHPDKDKIESAIVDNAELRGIARTFDVSEDALSRHKRGCIKKAIESVRQKQAEQTVQVAGTAREKREQFIWNLLGRIEWLDRQVRLVYEETRADKDHGSSIKALGEVRQQTKLFSELLAGQEPGQAEKLEAEWITVREAIFDALEPFPEARLAVAEALFALGRGNDHKSSQQLLEAHASEDVS